MKKQKNQQITKTTLTILLITMFIIAGCTQTKEQEIIKTINLNIQSPIPEGKNAPILWEREIEFSKKDLRKTNEIRIIIEDLSIIGKYDESMYRYEEYEECNILNTKEGYMRIQTEENLIIEIKKPEEPQNIEEYLKTLSEENQTRIKCGTKRIKKTLLRADEEKPNNQNYMYYEELYAQNENLIEGDFITIRNNENQIIYLGLLPFERRLETNPINITIPKTQKITIKIHEKEYNPHREIYYHHEDIDELEKIILSTGLKIQKIELIK